MPMTKEQAQFNKIVKSVTALLQDDPDYNYFVSSWDSFREIEISPRGSTKVGIKMLSRNWYTIIVRDPKIVIAFISSFIESNPNLNTKDDKIERIANTVKLFYFGLAIFDIINRNLIDKKYVVNGNPVIHDDSPTYRMYIWLIPNYNIIEYYTFARVNGRTISISLMVNDIGESQKTISTSSKITLRLQKASYIKTYPTTVGGLTKKFMEDAIAEVLA